MSRALSRPEASFAGSWVLVTGASSGLGLELSKALSQRGANLLLVARSRDKLVDLAADLQRINGVSAHALPCDLAAPGGPEALLERVRGLGVEVDHLVNDAGFGSSGPFAELDEQRERDMVRLNVEAIVTLTRALLPHMLAAGRGGVLNVASTAAFQAVPFMATYGATKAFVLSFTLALATELEGSGVRAMALCPGPVRTGFQAAAGFRRPGLELAVLSAQRTVEIALSAYLRGERVCVPGLLNSAQAVVTRLVPERLVSWAAARAMRRWGRT